MPEEDVNVFRDTCRLYEKWHRAVFTSLQQWGRLTDELHQLAARYDGNKLAAHLSAALIDLFEERYKDGYQPSLEEYFERRDLLNWI